MRRQSLALDDRDGRDGDEVGDPEPDDGPVARAERCAARRDDVERGRGVGVAPATAVQDDVAAGVGGDVAGEERDGEVRARDGTDRDEAREATPTRGPVAPAA